MVGSSNKKDHSKEPYSQSEGAFSNHHNMDYYQKFHRQNKPRSHHNYSKETKVNLPPFHGRENVEKYLDCEIKVEQIFEYHQVDHKRTVSQLSYHEVM